MEGLEKVRMNIYIKDSEKESFIEAIYNLSRERDFLHNNCFIITNNMREINEEEKKVSDRIDRWLKVKDSVIPERDSFKIWRRVKILEECKYDFKVDNEKLKVEKEGFGFGNKLLIEEIENEKNMTLNPFDLHNNI